MTPGDANRNPSLWREGFACRTFFVSAPFPRTGAILTSHGETIAGLSPARSSLQEM